MEGAKPFWAEGPIPPAHLDDYFVGRSDDVARLARRWGQRAPARTVIVAPARGGKRSLLTASLARTEAEVTPVPIRINRLLPETGQGLAGAVLAALVVAAPHPSLARAQRHLAYGPPEAAEEVLRQLDEAIARIPRRPLVVLEGADALAALPDGVLAAVDDLVATSKAHFVALADALPPRLAEHVPSLFGASGVRTTRLGPLPRREAADFIRARLAGVRCQATPDAIQLLVDSTGGDPASLQLVGARCHDVALRTGRGRLDESDVAEGLFLALESLPPEWTAVMGELGGRARDCFVALAVLDDPTVAAIGRRVGLDAKNVSVVLSRLVDRGAPVEKVGRGRFRITHALLGAWVRKEWTVVASTG